MKPPIDLNPIRARAIAATTDIGTALERAKAAAEFRHHAAADVLRLVEEVERLRELNQELSNQLQATQAELEQLQIEADAYDKYIKGGLSLGQLEEALKIVK